MYTLHSETHTYTHTHTVGKEDMAKVIRVLTCDKLYLVSSLSILNKATCYIYK